MSAEMEPQGSFPIFAIVPNPEFPLPPVSAYEAIGKFISEYVVFDDEERAPIVIPRAVLRESTELVGPDGDLQEAAEMVSAKTILPNLN